MYQPSHFDQSDRAALAALMHEHPLATLVSLQGGELNADAIPLEYDANAGEHGTLRGHVARANPLWRQAADSEVLAVFHGPQAYVSPNWYPSKGQTHKVVPTWNYAVVQAQGRLRVIDDEAWLHALVSRLTARHEAAQAKPWAVSDAPEDYLAQMRRAIVGVEIAVQRLVGKWKVSQNRGLADREGVAQGLQALGDAGAAAMAALVAPR